MSAAPSIDPSGHLTPAPPALGAEATQALFERHAGAIFGYCLNRLGGREEAEDAVQTTFLNAFRALQRGVVPDYEAAWLYTIAENVCRERHRSARRRLEVVQDPSAIEAAAPAAPHSGRDELLGLGEALGRMAPRQRRALLLREWKGLSYREIAQELRVSPAAVETLLFRARRSLARNLQVGSLVPWLKSLVGGSAAVKAAATAGVVVASASLAGGGPVEPQARPAAQGRAAAATPFAADRSASPGSAVASRLSDATARRVGATRSDRARERASTRSPGTALVPAGSPSEPELGGGPAPAGEQAGPSEPSSSPSPPPSSAGPPPAASPPALSPPTPALSPPTPALSPPTPPASLPVQAPATPPPPELPALPGLPSLPPPPPLPPAPQLPAPKLPATPSLPPAPQLPAPQPPATPELPGLPELPQLP